MPRPHHFASLQYGTNNSATIFSVLWIRIGFSADPDPAFFIYLNWDPDRDPDPGIQNNADPDPDQTFKF